MHALKIATGEPVWHWDVSKRGLNTAALMIGSDVIVTHSEENIGVERDGHDRRGAGGVEGDAHRQGRALDRARRAGGLRLAGRRTASGSTSSTTAASSSRSTSKTGKQLWTREARHDPEVLAGAGRRQAVRRHGERQVLHHPAARGQSRGPRQRSARHARRIPRQSSPPRPSRAAASTSSRWTAMYAHRAEEAHGFGCRGGSGAARRRRRLRHPLLATLPRSSSRRPT